MFDRKKIELNILLTFKNNKKFKNLKFALHSDHRLRVSVLVDVLWTRFRKFIFLISRVKCGVNLKF